MGSKKIAKDLKGFENLSGLKANSKQSWDRRRLACSSDALYIKDLKGFENLSGLKANSYKTRFFLDMYHIEAKVSCKIFVHFESYEVRIFRIDT